MNETLMLASLNVEIPTLLQCHEFIIFGLWNVENRADGSWNIRYCVFSQYLSTLNVILIVQRHFCLTS